MTLDEELNQCILRERGLIHNFQPGEGYNTHKVKFLRHMKKKRFQEPIEVIDEKKKIYLVEVTGIPIICKAEMVSRHGELRTVYVTGRRGEMIFGTTQPVKGVNEDAGKLFDIYGDSKHSVSANLDSYENGLTIVETYQEE
jgi:hypothetical protein